MDVRNSTDNSHRLSNTAQRNSFNTVRIINNKTRQVEKIAEDKSEEIFRNLCVVNGNI